MQHPDRKQKVGEFQIIPRTSHTKELIQSTSFQTNLQTTMAENFTVQLNEAIDCPLSAYGRSQSIQMRPKELLVRMAVLTLPMLTVVTAFTTFLTGTPAKALGLHHEGRGKWASAEPTETIVSQYTCQDKQNPLQLLMPNCNPNQDGKVLYYINGKAVYDSPPHVVKIGQISESEYCRRYGGQWCDRNYFKNKVEVSRQKIGKNVTQVEYSNGLRDYIHYCDDGDMTRKYSETTPGYIAVNTSTNSFVESIKYTAPPECAMRGKNSVIVNYQEKMNRCLAEGRCERFTPKETTRQLRWRGCMETIGNKHYKDKICGVYPLW